ncbi:MAG: alpha/beta fold hydrolase [Ktedonobacterales bacterium]
MSESRRAFCLLLHGFNGEPLDMRELEGELCAAGFAARTLLLPGHGTTARDFAAHGWDDWLAEVRAETQRALASYERVFVIGHSLGAALTLAVAATEPDVAGIVALCPPTRLNPHLGVLVRHLQNMVPYIPSWGEDVRDRWGARRYARSAYRWTALKTVHSLYEALPELRALLPSVRCPALIIAARHDHVVPARDAEETYRLIGSEQKELLILERSFHAVTKDVERHVVFARTLAFCQRESAPRQRRML